MACSRVIAIMKTDEQNFIVVTNFLGIPNKILSQSPTKVEHMYGSILFFWASLLNQLTQPLSQLVVQLPKAKCHKWSDLPSCVSVIPLKTISFQSVINKSTFINSRCVCLVRTSINKADKFTNALLFRSRTKLKGFNLRCSHSHHEGSSGRQLVPEYGLNHAANELRKKPSPTKARWPHISIACWTHTHIIKPPRSAISHALCILMFWPCYSNPFYDCCLNGRLFNNSVAHL